MLGSSYREHKRNCRVTGVVVEKFYDLFIQHTRGSVHIADCQGPFPAAQSRQPSSEHQDDIYRPALTRGLGRWSPLLEPHIKTRTNKPMKKKTPGYSHPLNISTILWSGGRHHRVEMMVHFDHRTFIGSAHTRFLWHRSARPWSGGGGQVQGSNRPTKHHHSLAKCQMTASRFGHPTGRFTKLYLSIPECVNLGRESLWIVQQNRQRFLGAAPVLGIQKTQ